MSRAVNKAFKTTPRSHFLPPSVAADAHLDMPLPIGYGQTGSQPTTIRLMLEWLAVRSGNRVLDLGSGSGWTTALLSRLVGSKGHVYAVERIPQLLQFGKSNCTSLGMQNVNFYQAGEEFGLPEEAPFHRILVSAVGKEIPQLLLDQLANNGRMVMPVGNDIVVVHKDKHGLIEQEVHPGFVFVPLIN